MQLIMFQKLQKEPKLDLENNVNTNTKFNNNFNQKENSLKKIVKPSDKELQLHKQYLKTHLSKNYY